MLSVQIRLQRGFALKYYFFDIFVKEASLRNLQVTIGKLAFGEARFYLTRGHSFVSLAKGANA
jgi:hypothetical protein